MSSNGARGRDSAYRTVAQQLRSAVLNGEYDNGARLPTEAELMASYGLSRHTVRRAIQDLEAEGLLLRVPGRGTFAAISPSTPASPRGTVRDLLGIADETDLEVVEPLRKRIDLDAASRLRLASDEVLTCSFRRLHDGVAFSFTRVYLPVHIGRLLDGTPELTQPRTVSRTSVVALLDERLELPITDAEQSIIVAELPPFAAAELPCEAGERVLRIDKMYSNSAGELVELAVAYYVPELYSYRMRLHRSGH
ncbi:GntR family transcriptional regulator [Dactylosporangium sucinum]|uniref:GntR family transcriptional regulator n=1 Tax=Dactylosporangium sucinum TaxID=1424081 RepID=A0A917UA78_9ACTN|nr:GntR family transcriptional regulator [Dactylosporangium sucinum]GGM69776.1 GntR family transcriptional regulator [Dactylosporangium sucinum]